MVYLASLLLMYISLYSNKTIVNSCVHVLVILHT